MRLTKFIIGALACLVLTACSNNYKIDVDLSADKIAELEATVERLKDEIAAYDRSDGTYPYLETIDLVNLYIKLGEIGRAIKIYESAIEDGARGRAIYNNLGRLYEQVENYGMAVVMYQRIIDEYFDQDYLYDVTWAYIRAKDRKNAEKFFNAWQLEFQKTDEQTQQAIKKLREAEKEMTEN